MPFGAITIAHRLGISNCVYSDAVSFGQTVLRLQTGFPVYQQQLVHSTFTKVPEGGPASGPGKAAAEWCLDGATDSDFASPYVIREISAHHTQFARRNLSNPPNQWSFDYHSTRPYPGQLYYLVNEADFASRVQDHLACDCWDPPDRTIDDLVDQWFLNPNSSYWEVATLAGFWTGQGGYCGTPSGQWKRAQPNVLAYLYAFLKDRGESPTSSNHVVLLPSSSVAQLGAHNCAGGILGSFWTAFFDALHPPPATITAGSSPPIATIPPTALAALHIHHYTPNPQDLDPPASLPPLEFVAFDAAHIKDGCEWYRLRYHAIPPNPSNAKLPFDLLISEMGLAWNMTVPWKWSAGWPNFRQALTWWNSYLCWLTRLAPTECKLISGKTVHALIHDPANRPYAATVNATAPEGTIIPQIGRNQNYLSINSMQVETLYNPRTLEIINADISNPPYPGTHTYQNSFLLTNNIISWQGDNWRTLPLGACTTVWARVGNDPWEDNLNTGWLYTETAEGDVYSASIILPGGFNTVYFPVIKDPGVFNPSTNPRIEFTWTRADGVNIQHGYMALHDFEDKPATDISVNLACNGTTPRWSPPQPVYPAMVYPVVVYSNPAWQVDVSLKRTFDSSNKVWLGRPIVLPGICSWFIEQ